MDATRAAGSEQAVSDRKCVACGKDPAEGFASVYRDGKEQWYCHPDEGESCYMTKSAGTWGEVVEVLHGTPIEFIGAEIQKRRPADE